MTNTTKWKMKFKEENKNDVTKIKRVEQRWQINNIPRKENQNDTLKRKHDILSRRKNTTSCLHYLHVLLGFEMFLLCTFFPSSLPLSSASSSSSFSWDSLSYQNVMSQSGYLCLSLSLYPGWIENTTKLKIDFFACPPVFLSLFSG